MRTSRGLVSGVVAIGIAALLAAAPGGLNAQQKSGKAVQIGKNDLGGVVTGKNGPDAGVRVIAEITDLPTRFARIVVTGDRGRYLIPDLPSAIHSVWVRGYGLVDSPKLRAFACGKFAPRPAHR